MRMFIQNAHIAWQSSFRKQSLPSPRSSRKSEARSERCMHTVIHPAADSCWRSPFLDFPFLLPGLSQSEFEISNEQRKILATFVPDVIIRCVNLTLKEAESFVGVVLLTDITGFTSFCEGGNSVETISKLTATLNSHLGAMVQQVYAAGGDVIKFSGDAILALWKVCSDHFLYQVIHHAIHCALSIQSELGGRLGPQVDLKVKVAISAGNFSFGVIGTEKARHYVLVGAPIHDLKRTQGLCGSGEVILTPSAWSHCIAHNYHHTASQDGHVKVQQIIHQPLDQELSRLDLTIITHGLISGCSRSAHQFHDPSVSKDISFRQSIDDGLGAQLAANLRTFMAPPIVQQIEADQPLEYLTEMRQVTTMFINLIPSEKLDDRQLIQLVDDVYCTVTRLVTRALGCLTKVSLFDKDVMLLAVFGLRGYKHEQESRRSLRCGLNVKRAVAHIPGVGIASVGITTGMVYCGVVGHSMRREYTVIGAQVNKAARIMCTYPDRVTCDRMTRIQSNLPPHFFILQEPLPIKGIEQVGPVFEYTEGIGSDPSRMSTRQGLHHPLLGRENLMGEIECLFHSTATREPHRHVQAVVLQGDSGVGKTRVLRELTLRAEHSGLRTYSVTFQPRHGATPFSALQFVCQQMLEENAMTMDQFLQLLDGRGSTTSFSDDDVSLLDESLNPNSERGDILQRLTPFQKRERLPMLISWLMRLALHPTVIVVDDLHLMDDHTWKLCSDVLDLLSTHGARGAPTPTLIVASFSPRESYMLKASRHALMHPAVMLRNLLGLPAELLAPLACQLLSADGIQRQVVEVLDSHSRGNPGWCANYLDSMVQSEALQVQPLPLEAAHVHGVVLPDLELLLLHRATPRTMGTSACSGVCYLRTQEADSQEDTPASSRQGWDALAQVRNVIVMMNHDVCERKAASHANDVIVSSFDYLSPYEQLVLKCASVTANTQGGLFTRDMLMFLLKSVHTGSDKRAGNAIKELFEMGVLECGSTERDEENKCMCSFKGEGTPNTSESCCELLNFQMSNFQETIYELLPGNQRRRFHLLAIEYLESQWMLPLVCQACLSAQVQQPEAPRPPYRSSNASSTHLSSSSAPDSRSSFSLPSQWQRRAAQGEEAERQPRSYTIQGWVSHLFRDRKVDVKGLVSNINVRVCECPKIIVDTLSQLIDHCHAAEKRRKELYYMAEYGFMSILSGDPLEAIEILSDAKKTLLSERLLGDMDSISRVDGESDDECLSDESFLGKVQTLIGHACLSMGEIGRAQEFLSQALATLGIPWPQRGTRGAVLQWLRRLPACPCLKGGRQSERRLQQAACLSLLSDFYSASGAYSESRAAAVASLRLASMSTRTPSPRANVHLCSALSSALESSIQSGDLGSTSRLESRALRCVRRYLEKQFIYSSLTGRFFARLLCAVFVRRFLLGELMAAKDVGIVVLHTSERLCSWRASLFILPLLARTHAMLGEFGKAFSKLRKLKSVSENNIEDEYMSAISCTNYHVLCLDILLDAGQPSSRPAQQRVVEEAARHVLQLLTEEQDRDRDRPDPRELREHAEQSIMVRLWLWFARQNDKENGNFWRGLIGEAGQKLADWSALRFLEVLLVEQGQGALHVARQLLTQLQHVVQTTPVLLPRFLHLRSYYSMLHRGPIHSTLSLHYLASATHYARKHGNHLEMEWCQHTKKVWQQSELINETYYTFMVPNDRVV